MSGWNGRIGSCRHTGISFMNSTKSTDHTVYSCEWPTTTVNSSSQCATNQYMRGRLSEKNSSSRYYAFSSTHFLRCVMCLNDTSLSERTSRNTPARNTLVQLLALYINPESHNAQRHRQTDGRTDRRTDDRIMPISRSYCVAVQSAKNHTSDTTMYRPWYFSDVDNAQGSVATPLSLRCGRWSLCCKFVAECASENENRSIFREEWSVLFFDSQLLSTSAA